MISEKCSEKDKDAVLDQRLAGQPQPSFGWTRKWWRGGDRTANATVSLTLGTIILAAANLGMLIEMHFAAHRQHKDTVSALGKTEATIAALKYQGNTMNGQLQEMEVARRPWVTADISFSQGATFSDRGVAFGLNFILRNIGLNPAWGFVGINAYPFPQPVTTEVLVV